MTTWFRCGARETFAIEVRLIDDPDPRSAPIGEAWSYGELRLFVRGRCLTRNTGPDGAPRDEVRWYLAPLLNWLATSWTPLFHEQRPPPILGDHENLIVAFEQGERLLIEDERPSASEQRAAMQAWRGRHALWSGAAGGVFPNIWFRRQSDLMEVSFDPGTTVGAPSGLEFQFNRGAILVDVAAVAAALDQFLDWSAPRARSPFRHRPEIADGLMAVEWLVGPKLANLLRRRDMVSRPAEHGILYPLSPAVAMFGTLTPQTSERDAEELLAAVEDARSNNAETSSLASLVEYRAPPIREAAWEEGYDVALNVLDRSTLTASRLSYVNVDAILRNLGVRVKQIQVEDGSLRGIAIAGEGFSPTILVNLGARWNQSNEGFRFTLAHELAHILLDRGAARRITHASTPWAPESLEKRANAFAAMLLMPPIVLDAALTAVGRLESFDDLKRLSRRLKCGKSAVLEHLMNLDRITLTQFYRLRAEMSRP